MTAETKLDSIMQRFNSLPIKQKIIFLASLCFTSVALICVTILLCFSTIKKFNDTKKLLEPQKVWLSKASKIERELGELELKYLNVGTSETGDLKLKIEQAADETGANYTLGNLAPGTLGKINISRTNVIFPDAHISSIIDFFNNISKIGDNVAISEIKITAQGNMLLNAHCVVSTLEMK